MNELDAPSFYVTGGTVPADSPSYIPRAADGELLAALTRGELCYVLNARQMGKSSLCVRTRQALQTQGIRTAFLDLQKFGSSATPEQWYRSLLERLGHDLKLRTPFLTYWRDNAERAPLDRLFGALRDVALEQTTEPIVVFLDEIDVVRDLSFKTDEFFGAIRQTHNARVDDAVYNRLTFCIIGTVAPTDLIKDVRLSPFNIGTRIRLLDFTPIEVAPLASPLPGGTATLSKVLSWTSGHPYLTQRVCSELTTSKSADVDAMVSRLFFAKSDSEVDENVKNVRNAVLRGGDLGVDRTDLLMRYGLIVGGKRVVDDDTDPVCTALRLSGLVSSVGGALKPRCRVYATLFDAKWVRENLPDAEVRRQKAAVTKARWQVGLIAAVVIQVFAGLSVYSFQQTKLARESAKASQEAKRTAETERAKAEGSARLAERRAEEAQVAREKETAAREREEAAKEHEAAARESAQASAEKATELARVAESEKQRAQAQTKIAQINGDTASRLAYISNCNLAHKAIKSEDYSTAQQYLDEMGNLLKSNPHLEAGYEWTYLNEQMHMERLELKGHTAPVRSVAYSSDGKRILTGSEDKTARLWDASTGREQLQLRGHVKAITSVAYSPDSKLVVTGSDDKTALVWSAKTGKKQLRIVGHSQAITSVAYSPDGKYIATASEDKTARIWDATTGREYLQLRGHTGKVNALAYFPDGKRLVTGSDDKTARIWDTSTGRELLQIKDLKYAVTTVAASPKGTKIATGGLSGSEQMWDSSIGKEINIGERWVRWSNEKIASIVFLPDDMNLVVGDGMEVRTTDPLFLDRRLGHLQVINSIASSPDGRRIVTGSRDCTARVWDISVWRGYYAVQSSHEKTLPKAFASVFNSLVIGRDDTAIRFLDTLVKRRVMRLNDRTQVLALAVSRDGKKFIDNAAHVRETTTGREFIWLNGPSESITSAAFSPDGTRIATASTGGTITIWDTSTGRELIQFLGPGYSFDGFSPYEVIAIAFTPDGKELITRSRTREDTYIVVIWRRLTDPQVTQLASRREKITAEGMRVEAMKKQGEEIQPRAEQQLVAGDLVAAHRAYTELARLLPDAANPWLSTLPNLIIGDRKTHQDVTVAQLRLLTDKSTATEVATVVRRAAIVPKLFDDYTPYLALGKRAVDEASERAAKPKTDDDMIFYSYGAILLRAGKTREAIVQLEKATALKLDRVQPMQFLTLAYVQNGDKVAARRWFDKTEAWMKTEMDKQQPGAANWWGRLQVLLLWREAKLALEKS